MMKSQQVGAETMGKRWLYLSLVPAWDSVLPGHGSLSHLQDEDWFVSAWLLECHRYVAHVPLRLLLQAHSVPDRCRYGP